MNRTFKTPKGTELPLMDIKGKPYLSVQNRIVWFREEKPDWSIETEPTHAMEKESRFKAIIRDASGILKSTAHKREDLSGFADHYEKAESGAIGRALGFLGYGTAFALELEEDNRLADAPAEEKKSPPQVKPQVSTSDPQRPATPVATKPSVINQTVAPSTKASVPSVPKEVFDQQVNRLKNSYPGKPGPKMPTPYKDEPPWPEEK